MSATIKEIADIAGVSSATVSLVLNERPGVGQETRDKILQIAAEIGYAQRKTRPTASARTRAIRFLRIVKHGHIINPNHRVFIADYIDGIEREVKRFDYRLEIHTQEGFDSARIMKEVDPSVFDGIVVLGTELDETDMESFRISPLPVVFIDTYHPYLGFDFVDMDNEASVFRAMEFLYQKGHRHIGLVKSTVDTRNFRLRERAFRDILERFDLAFDERDAFAIDSTFETGKADMTKQLNEERPLPTALFCLNDVIAYACAHALRESGRKLPEDVSLVGFDDLPSNIYMDPKLTSIKVSKRNIGRRAIQLLMDRLENPTRPFEKVLVGGELIVRDSVRELKQ